VSRPETEMIAVQALTGRRRSRARARFTTRPAPYVFVLPLTIFVAVLFIWPLVQMVVSTMFVTDPQTGATTFSLQPFEVFFTGGRGWDLIARTVRIAVITTALTFLLAYPVTLWIRETGPRLRGLLIVLMLSPMLTSDVVRTLGWITILGPTGLIAEGFQALGIPAPRMLYTEGAVEIGLTQIFIGFMVLSLLSSVLRIPEDVISAAANLGAGRWQVLTRIVLPMSVPGIIGGVAIVFPLAASTYVTASLLGGTSKPVLGTELYKQALVNVDFGAASAVGLILFAIILIVIVLIGILTRSTDRRSRKA
jgi:putative spermidine/putrescine transport system permease protein